MFKHNDVLNEIFQKYASNEQVDLIEVANSCNNMFQESNMLALKGGKKDVKDLQQSTSVLNRDGNKMSVQESVKVKEKAPNKFDKEGIGSKNTYFWFWFQKGTWKWQKHLVKSRRKYKARQPKNHHVDNV